MNRNKARLLPALPTPVHRWLRRRKRASPTHDHRDAAFLQVTSKISFETYWKDVEAGRGPALIVWFADRKILKFDCFGKGRGHYHVVIPVYGRATQRFDRLLLPEDTIEAQIERTIFELRHNLHFFLARSPYPRARRTVVPPDALAKALDEVRRRMHEGRRASC